MDGNQNLFEQNSTMEAIVCAVALPAGAIGYGTRSKSDPEITQKTGQIVRGGKAMSEFVSHSVFIVATWIAAIFGGIGVGAAFISAIVGYQLTENALSDSRVKISAADARASEANNKAEEEKLARLKLEAQFAWRRVTVAQKEKMIAELSGSPQSVFVIWITGDPEAMLLAWQLLDIFQKSNWAAGGEGRQYPDSIVTNLLISGPASGVVMPLMKEVGLSPAESTLPPFTGMVIPHPTGVTEGNADVVIVVGSRLRPDDAAVLEAIRGTLGKGAQ